MAVLFVSCDKKDDPIEIYDGGQWEKCLLIFPGTPDRWLPVSYAVNDTLIYGFGDYYPSALPRPVFNDLFMYTSQGWSRLSDFPGRPRMMPVLFLKHNKVYCGLGSDYQNELKDLWSYDLATKSWDSLKMEFPGEERIGGLLFEAEGKIYYGAGKNKGEILNDMYIFDPEDGWQQADPFYVDRQAYTTVFTLNREIYACFGEGEPYTIRKFSTQDKKWHSVYLLKKEERAAIARTDAKAFVLKEKEGEFAYIVGGKPATNGAEEEFWPCVRYNPRTNVLERVNTPKARKIEAAFTVDNTGYIFDGRERWKFIP